jgi:PAS domain S-box-containing protein
MPQTPAPARAPAPSAVDDRPGSVLVVEDHPDHAQLIGVLLQRGRGQAWTARWATTLLQAEEKISERHPDVVVLDLNLPDSSGLATVARLCRRHPEVPVVVATSHDEADLGVEAIRRGAQDYLVKGTFDAALLSRSLRLAIARKQEERALEALSASERRYRELFERSLAGMFRSTLSGTMVDCNQAFVRILGFGSREEVLATPASELYWEDGGREVVLARLQERGVFHGLELRLRRADGEPVWVLAAGGYVRNEHGAPQGIEGTVLDITPRRAAEEALRRSEEGYRLLFESNPQPMWVYEEGTLRILAVNASAVRQYGYPRDEFLSMTLRDIRPEADVPALEDALARRDPVLGPPVVVRHRRKDGVVLDVEVFSHAITLDGRAGRLVVATNVTERRRLEDQLRQAQKMEALGRLAGGVSHDFNNLLGVISGYSELALRSVDPGSAIARRLEEIRRAAGRAAELTTQLLAFSRRQVLEPQVVHLNAVVSEAEKMLRRLIGEHIQLVTLLSDDLGHVKADPGQVTQIILNLAVNARDAMPGGGRLMVETANVDLDERYAAAHPDATAGRHVLLSVTDTGSGMDAETRSRAFEPFFTTKPVGEGTGLGLATVYGIVRQSGGHLTLYSEPGRGSTFRVYLPRVDESPAPAAAPPTAAVPGGGETVLLVEDDAALREMTREVLADAGYRVILASAGDEAFEQAAREPGPIHLVLTDVVMPRMTGPELGRRLAGPRPGIRMLYMSGYTEGAIMDLGALEPDAAFVSKPFTPDRLLARVRDVLDAKPSPPEPG